MAQSNQILTETCKILLSRKLSEWCCETSDLSNINQTRLDATEAFEKRIFVGNMVTKSWFFSESSFT